MFAALDLGRHMEHETGDICSAEQLKRSVAAFSPEFVIHMAAQPLVRRSYQVPLETYQTNVIGTANLLEAVRACPSVRVAIVVTTDKCYENLGVPRGYREEDSLGGHDPYSSSKACAEIVASSYRRSFLGPAGVAVATARAGNVLGGGDWSEDRIVPDAVRAFASGKPLAVRNPDSIRPWQHVLEALSGYLVLAEEACARPEEVAAAWNFGPSEQDIVPVRKLANELVELWGPPAAWEDASGNRGVHEAQVLKLDIDKAREKLRWAPRIRLGKCLEWTVEWYRAFQEGASAGELLGLTHKQIEERAALPP
jgi:CDP-glucose 4,6-dehydratase